MINCAVVFDGRVTRVVYDDTHQGLLGSCVIFSQTMAVALKNSFRNSETVIKVGWLIFRAFQCEMELDYITVSCRWHRQLVDYVSDLVEVFQSYVSEQRIMYVVYVLCTGCPMDWTICGCAVW